MKINVAGFASEFSATFPTEGTGRAFLSALLDVGSPLTEREARGLALSLFGIITEALPEHEALALDLAEQAEREGEMRATLDMLHELIATA